MLEEMRKMIAEQLSCDENEITADTSFKDDLGADSRQKSLQIWLPLAM